MNQANTFDVVVIGAGAAGSSLASAAVERGCSVALLEEWKVGGTCLNIGCDPTKTLVRSAEVAQLARKAQRLGIDVDGIRVNWPAIRQRLDDVINTIRGGDGDQNVRDQGITLIKEHGRFVDANTVVGGDHRIVADLFVIATGASNIVPPIHGLEDVGFITNDDALSLMELPDSLVIVGAGSNGLEFAQIFARLGVEVTLIGSRDRVLPKEEPALSEAIVDVLQSEGVTWVPELRIDRAVGRNGHKVLSGTRNHDRVDLAAKEIMIATGRRPNVHRLGLEDAGVKASEKGIVVDSTLRTTNPSIYAIGDVTGIYAFTHVADYQARIAAHNLFNPDSPRKADYKVVPWVTFTDPELARVGLTEAEARAGGYDAVSATVPFKELPRAITMDERDGMVKLIVDRNRRTILGGHILASRGGELIGEVALAMKNGLRVDAIASTIHPYPTMSEGVFWAEYQIVNEKLGTKEAVYSSS